MTEDRTMTTAECLDLHALYEADETAWLEAMSALAANGHQSEMDFTNLSEYLADMAKRDRREVVSRLVVLLAHLLKWDMQPERRSGSWRDTIRDQRWELLEILESGTLRNHAEAVLADVFSKARQKAADQTDLELTVFPTENPWSLDELLVEPDA
jgi:hypothetical protein